MKRLTVLMLAMLVLFCSMIVMLVSCTTEPAASSDVSDVSSNGNPFASFTPTSKGDISVDEGDISRIAPPESYDPASQC